MGGSDSKHSLTKSPPRYSSISPKSSQQEGFLQNHCPFGHTLERVTTCPYSDLKVQSNCRTCTRAIKWHYGASHCAICDWDICQLCQRVANPDHIQTAPKYVHAKSLGNDSVSTHKSNGHNSVIPSVPISRSSPVHHKEPDQLGRDSNYKNYKYHGPQSRSNDSGGFHLFDWIEALQDKETMDEVKKTEFAKREHHLLQSICATLAHPPPKPLPNSDDKSQSQLLAAQSQHIEDLRDLLSKAQKVLEKQHCDVEHEDIEDTSNHISLFGKCLGRVTPSPPGLLSPITAQMHFDKNPTDKVPETNGRRSPSPKKLAIIPYLQSTSPHSQGLESKETEPEEPEPEEPEPDTEPDTESNITTLGTPASFFRFSPHLHINTDIDNESDSHSNDEDEVPPLEPLDLPALQKAEENISQNKVQETEFHQLFEQLGIDQKFAKNCLLHNLAIENLHSLSQETLRMLIPESPQRSKLVRHLHDTGQNGPAENGKYSWQAYILTTDQHDDERDHVHLAEASTPSSDNLSDAHSTPTIKYVTRRRSREEPARLPSSLLRKRKTFSRHRSNTPPPSKFSKTITDEEFQIIDVDQKSEEFVNVRGIFKESLTPPASRTLVISSKKEKNGILMRCRLVGLKKVINPTLERTFETTRCKLPFGYYSQYAFHGTSRKNIDRICREGLLPVGHSRNNSSKINTGNMGNPKMGVNLTSLVDYAARFSKNKRASLREGDIVQVVAFKIVLGRTRYYSPRKIEQIPKGKRIVGISREGKRRYYKYDSYTMDENRQIYLTKPEHSSPLYIFEVQLVRDTRSRQDQHRALERYMRKHQLYQGVKSPKSIMRITSIPEEAEEVKFDEMWQEDAELDDWSSSNSDNENESFLSNKQM